MRTSLVLSVLLAACAEDSDATVGDGRESVTAPGHFTVFESGQVRPLSLSPDGKRLFAVNTPDSRLEIFDVTRAGLVHRHSIAVGLEPVAVAARSSSEVWVVNHLSDSISIVSIDALGRGEVTSTLLVGDEPRDIVFAGSRRDRAFITTAHRGQNNPRDPQLTTPGVGRADVWVFDANKLGSALGGTPLSVVSVFTDTPRALAVTPDGGTVYVAGFHTGNQTTSIPFFPVLFNGGRAPPLTSAQGAPVPFAGIIVKDVGGHWLDADGRTWDSQVRLDLPDKDVFAIDANATPPVQLAGSAGFYTGVGTTLFDMVVNPVSGKVYVTNTDARNEVRFEGHGTFSGGETTRGHIAESRITVLTPGGGVTPRHLNKHIDYDTCCAPVPNAENAKSVAQPVGLAVSASGTTLYVAGFGSSKVAIYNTASLENDTFVPNQADQIGVSGGGPTGVVLDEPRGRLYVMTRFDNSISVIDTTTKKEIAHRPLFNPEPASVVTGRRFLYDASLTSSHGDSSCGSCHIFGDLDALAWELGDPDADMTPIPGPFATATTVPLTFHPMKGPMTTQSLRGMANHGPMHWRGDRTGGNDAPSAQPDSGTFDEVAAFKKFNPAFESLLGSPSQLTDAQMQSFTDFALQITYPPNPIRALDNSRTPTQQQGFDVYRTILDLGPPGPDGAPMRCIDCHVLDPDGNREHGVAAPGFFGTEGMYVQEAIMMKIPHLRNLYQKVGMFGTVGIAPGHDDPGQLGDQIRGFGFFNDGSVDQIETFMQVGGFGFPAGPMGDTARQAVTAFLLAYDSNLKPIVGQQITRTRTNAAVVDPRIALFTSRADAGDCDLIARGRFALVDRGWLYLGGGRWRPDRAHGLILPTAALRDLYALTSAPLTFTCTPPGSGVRMALDHDGDGRLDGDD